jgi:hypothetical protein
MTYRTAYILLGFIMKTMGHVFLAAIYSQCITTAIDRNQGPQCRSWLAPACTRFDANIVHPPLFLLASATTDHNTNVQLNWTDRRARQLLCMCNIIRRSETASPRCPILSYHDSSLQMEVVCYVGPPSPLHSFSSITIHHGACQSPADDFSASAGRADCLGLISRITDYPDEES